MVWVAETQSFQAHVNGSPANLRLIFGSFKHGPFKLRKVMAAGSLNDRPVKTNAVVF